MKKYLIIAIAILAVAGVVGFQQCSLAKLKAKNESLTQTKGALLDSVRHYQTKDGLNAAQMAAIRLTVDELKRYRADDLKLIESLKTKGRDVERVVTVNTHTRDTLYTVLKEKEIYRDTIHNNEIFRDTIYNNVVRYEPVPIKVKAIDIEKPWYSLHGYIDGDTLVGDLQTRSSLKIVETVKYKRFLGFLWKTNKVKDRKIDVTSLNPNETIENVEYIVVDK